VADKLVAAADCSVIDMAGRLTFGQTAAAIERCDVYVGNDTGVTILASAVGTPVVAIFGPSDPRRYGPVDGAGIAVAPPGRPVNRLADAAGSRAVDAVTVEQVLSAVEQVLSAVEPIME
jgi:ADP-heptose:LPS heptosyltransferase